MAGLIEYPFGAGLTSDINSISKSGLYGYNDSTANSTLGYTWGMIAHFQNSQDWGTFQLATTNKASDQSLYFRKKEQGEWIDWIKIN